MTNNKYLGFTLLFFDNANKRSILMSFVKCISNKKQLDIEIENIKNQYNHLDYIGFYDVFNSSNLIDDKLISLTHYFEFTDKPMANKLLLDKNNDLEFKYSWNNVGMVYFYDEYSIICNTLLQANNIDTLEKKIGLINNNINFKSKILESKVENKFGINSLIYIGIHSIQNIDYSIINGGPVEILYNNELDTLEKVYKEFYEGTEDIDEIIRDCFQG